MRRMFHQARRFLKSMLQIGTANLDIREHAVEPLPFAAIWNQLNAEAANARRRVPTRHVRSEAERIRTWLRTGRMPAAAYWK
jgi:hypothetical protein